MVDQVAGGRLERKREGWRYEPDVLGWLCDVCARRVTWSEQKPKSVRSSVEKSARNVDNAPDARGFGLRRPELGALVPRRSSKNRRARRRARGDQDRAQLAGKVGARANRRRGLHAELEPRRGRRHVLTLEGPPNG